MSGYRSERKSKMRKSIKKLVLMGAVVMVMMSFAAPAMAKPSYEDDGYVDYISIDVAYDGLEDGQIPSKLGGSGH
jgi:hypothetical protein